jgi:hypothetical protein
VFEGPARQQFGRGSFAAAVALFVLVAILSVAAATRPWETRSHAGPRAARVAGADYRAIAGQMAALDVAGASITPGLQSCGARLNLRSFDAPPTCFRAASDAYVKTAFGLWTTLGRADRQLAKPCQARVRALRRQLDLSATLVKQTNMAVESLNFDQFHALAQAIPQLAPMYASARTQFAAACSPA